MQNPPRKHHYIPIFYTKAWAGKDRNVVRYTKPYGSVVDRRVHPARVGWELDLYKIPDAPIDREHALEEQFFKQLDNVASRAHRKLISTPQQTLTAEELSAWSTFIMSLLHRSPDHLRTIRNAGPRFWQAALQEIRDEGETDPAVIEAYLEISGPQEGEKSILRNLPNLIANPNIGQFLNNCHWARIDVPLGEDFLLLSDDPLARTNGLKKDDGHIAMPLSPRHLLVAGYRKKTVLQFHSMPVRQLVKNMNGWTVKRARHFVAATSTSQGNFIKHYFGTEPLPGILEQSVAREAGSVD